MTTSNLQSSFEREEDRFAGRFISASVGMTSVTYGIGRYAFGLFIPEVRHNFGAATADLGIIASFSSFGYLLACLLSSYLAGRAEPRSCVIVAGIVTTLGLAIVGIAANVLQVAIGVVLAGIGAGIYGPASIECIYVSLPSRRRIQALSAVNAGATPGLIITGLIAFALPSQWQLVWLVMASLAALVTLWNSKVIKSRILVERTLGPRIARAEHAYGPSTLSRVLSLDFAALCSTICVYGLLYKAYLTFAVDLLVSFGGLRFPYDRLFWVTLGVAGVPTIFVGPLISRFGVRGILTMTIPVCGLSCAMLGLAPNSGPDVILSAALFGVSSIAPGSALLVWSLRIFCDRPATASGAAMFCFAAAIIVTPLIYAMLVPWMTARAFFIGLLVLSLIVVPLFPQNLFDVQ